MRKRILWGLATAALCVGTVVAATSGQALVSLSYLTNTFTNQFLEKVDSQGTGDTLYQQALAQVEAAAGQTGLGSGGSFAAYLTESSLKEKDMISGSTGFVLVPLAGSIQVSFASGTVIDVTSAVELASGDLLSANHKYMVAENTTASFTVRSQVAVVQYEGSYTTTPATDTVDYVAMADALKSLQLFKGSDTGYGGGYNLDRNPTRLQALIMFLRVLGEEEAALASTAAHPFQDVPAWGSSYVAYAYEKGYTNGLGNGRFGTDSTVSCASYVEFLLRALGYSQVGVDDWRTSLTRAVNCGLITTGEKTALESGDFLRAQVVYLSFRSLDAYLSGSSETLGQRLVRQGLFSSAQLQQAKNSVSSVRLG